MRFGVCAGPERAAVLAAAGYDYIEPGAASELVPESDESVWAEKRRVLETMPLRPETFNLFVRGPRITGPEVDTERLRRYVQTALSRADQVGGKVIVFGSAGARNIPDGFSPALAEQQLLTFLNLCADASAATGVVVAIEPLNTSESNVIHTVDDGARLARLVGRPGVQNLADTYHMEHNGEALDAILRSADCLCHVHTADTGRKAPGTGHYDHAALFATLRAAGYDSRVSIECSFTDFETEIVAALAHLKRAYAV